jgi:hypothetical protein
VMVVYNLFLLGRFPLLLAACCTFSFFVALIKGKGSWYEDFSCLGFDVV